MSLNLDYLIPEKYRSSEIMSALLDELDVLFSGHIESIEGLLDLSNPETVSNDFMQYLADLLGITLTSEDDATESQRRAELVQAVDWIKLKGTYQSIQVIGLALGLTLSIADMYTNDYSTFVLKDWFVGQYEDHNPTGLDSTYYKSPHFGIQVKLNIKYDASGSWIYDYLWIPDMYSNLSSYVEKTRPIHTVPHYYLLMEPEANDNNQVTQVEGEINTAIIGSWTVTRGYFDDGGVFDTTPTEYFDESQDAFYQGITKWVLGSGNKGLSPSDSAFEDIESPISGLTGDVNYVKIYADRVEWEILVPATTQDGISELGLYTPGTPDVLRIVSLFPDINILSETILRIIVTINRV